MADLGNPAQVGVQLAAQWETNSGSKSAEDLVPNSRTKWIVVRSGPTASTSDLQFAITKPSDGAKVTTDTVTVKGTGPAGATVTRDISLSPDEHTTVSQSGTWSMSVWLDPGQNDLKFRLGDFEYTAITLTVTYQP